MALNFSTGCLARVLRSAIPSQRILCQQFSSKQKRTIVASGLSKPSTKRIYEIRRQDKRRLWEEKMTQEESVKDRQPSSDVYFAPHFAPQLLSVSEAIEVHKELALPEMLNFPTGALYLHFQFNMRTNKKTKFLHDLSTKLLLPHNLDFIPKKKIIVFTSNPDEMNKAKEMGAFDANGISLVEQMQHGYYHWESYDNVICHRDFYPNISPLKKLLKDRYPTERNGKVTADIPSTLTIFMNGIDVEATKDPSIPEIATCTVPLGRLDWSLNDLRENYAAYLAAIESAKSPRTKGELIEAVEMLAPPSTLRLRLKTTDPMLDKVDVIDVKAEEIEEEEEDDEPEETEDAELLITDDDDDDEK